MVNGRHYVQPQWVVDCANERIVLPCGSYAPGKALPPHLSPFVDDSSVGYTPDQRRRLDTLKERIAAGTLIDESDTLEAIVPDSAIGGATDGDAGSDSEDDSDADGDSDAGGDDDDTDAGDSSDEEDDDEDDGEANEAEAAYQAELRGERGGADADAAGRKAKQAVAQKRKRKQEADDNEATEMAKVMMSKKDRRLYGQIAYTNRKKQEAAEKLEAKKLAAKKARK
jgi:pescadillo protein